MRAADQSGIYRDYWDVFGHRHEVQADARRQILNALGWSVDNLEALEQQRLQVFERDYVQPLPTTLVLSLTDRAVPLTLEQGAEGTICFELKLEQAESGCVELAHSDVLSGSLHTSQLAVRQEVQVNGRSWTCYEVQLPSETPLGYHRFRATLNGNQLGQTDLIFCPDRTYLPEWLEHGGKTAGFNVTLYGLRSQRNWGCGDFTDLRALINWARQDVGFSFIGLNPLHAIHNRVPYNTSPYLPNSMFYKNWIYVDVEAVPEFHHSQCAQALLASPRVQAHIETLRNAEFVQYSAVDQLKKTFLRILHREFHRRRQQEPERARAFEQYCASEGDLLHRFALYCALDQKLHAKNPDLWTWPQWPEEYRDPDSEACREFAASHWRTVEFYKYVQWVTQEQLDQAQQFARQAGMPIGLYHDLAVATDSFGSDLWAHRAFYVNGCRVGAPPDDFSPNGQDWAFPPPNTLAHRNNGYRLYRDSIRKIVRSGGALRIDHVMRLFRLFWIPDGFQAPQGTYVNENATDLLRILALESVRSQNIIVGEDLGTVTEQMRAGLTHYGVLSYRLFWFEKRESDKSFKRPDEYPRQALVASSTHDLATLTGFWIGRDIEARRQAGLVDHQNYQRQKDERTVEKQRILDVLHEQQLLPQHYERNASLIPAVDGDLHNAVIGFLARMPSLLLLLNGEDFTKEENQQNLPGSTEQYPNWQRKMAVTLDELRSPKWQPYSAMFRHQLQQSGRA